MLPPDPSKRRSGSRGRGALREHYYRAVFEAFLRYIAAGEPMSMRTAGADGRTEVTLGFSSDAFAEFMERLDLPSGELGEGNASRGQPAFPPG